MNHSRILAVSFAALCLSCCARQAPPDPAETFAAYNRVRELSERYGEQSSPFQQEYFQYLALRLTKSLPESSRLPHPLAIVLLDADEPIAATPGGGFVVLSKNLVLRLQTEGELAFIVAHELSHQILGHELTPDLRSEERRELELEADARALAILAVAGYDLRVAPAALVHASRSVLTWNPDFDNPDYPSVGERIQALQARSAESRWAPPGTVDRRDFQTLKRQLLS